VNASDSVAKVDLHATGSYLMIRRRYQLWGLSGVMLALMSFVFAAGCGPSVTLASNEGGGSGSSSGTAGAGDVTASTGTGFGGRGAGGGSSSGAGGAAGDASTSTGAGLGGQPPCSPAATLPCNGPPACGPWVAQQQIPQNAPTPSGGLVQSGTYVMIADSRYTGPGGASGPDGVVSRESLVLASDGTYANTTEVSSNSPYALTGTYMTNGAQFSVTDTCSSPALPTLTLGFTSNSKQLLLFGSDSDGVIVTAYTKMLVWQKFAWCAILSIYLSLLCHVYRPGA
jgi:hypothetical protein